MINPNWPRWIRANIVNYFMEVSNKINFPFYIDRYDREVSWAELRLGGPYINNPSSGWYNIDVDINILVTCYVTDNDRYLIDRVIGHYQSSFKPLCLYKYGDGPDDDHTYFATMNLKDNNIDVSNFGLIVPEAKYYRSAVSHEFDVSVER